MALSRGPIAALPIGLVLIVLIGIMIIDVGSMLLKREGEAASSEAPKGDRKIHGEGGALWGLRMRGLPPDESRRTEAGAATPWETALRLPPLPVGGRASSRLTRGRGRRSLRPVPGDNFSP